METARTEKTEAGKIEMEVVQVHSLPEKFRPPSGGAPAPEDVPGYLAELIQEATSGLNGPKRKVFLRRLGEEHPGVFSGKNGEDSQQLSEEPTGKFSEKEFSKEEFSEKGFSEEQFSEEEWREELTRLLKEEANRLVAAAAGL